jgi:transcriptional regulator with XRE-family HTH domain
MNGGVLMQQQLGETIRKYRNKKGYTIKQLADKLNISIGLLSNIETGKTDSFQLNLLNNFVNELEIPISELKLFFKPYPVEELNTTMTKDFSKINSSLEILINAFYEASSQLSFNRDETSLMANMLTSELRAISKLIKATKSK